MKSAQLKGTKAAKTLIVRRRPGRPRKEKVEDLLPEDELLVLDHGSDIDPDEENEQNAADRVEVMMREADGATRAEVRVYRVKPNKAEVLCNHYTPEEYEQGGAIMLRENHGPGTYRVVLFAQKPPSNMFCRRWGQTIEIEAVLNEKKTSPAAVNDALAQALTDISNRLQSLESNRRDPMQELGSMFSLMEGFRNAMGYSPQQQQNSNTMATALDQLTKNFELMKALRENIEPPEKGADPISDMLPKILEVIMHQQQTEQPPSRSRAVTQFHPAGGTNHVPPPPPPPAPAPPIDEEDEELDDFTTAEMVTQLNSFAQIKADPKATAELIYPECPAEVFLLLLQPEWFANLCKVEPRAEPYRNWYLALATELLQLHTAPGAPQTNA